MQNNFIGRVIDYYLASETSPLTEIERADFKHQYFGNRPNVLEEEGGGLFTEWLLLEWVPAGGVPGRAGRDATLLGRWVADNPKGLGSTALRAYRTLLETHVYGWFEVREVRTGTGLTLMHIATDRVYEVRERSLTYQVQPGALIIARVGQVDDHVEMVSGSGVTVPFTFGATMRGMMRNDPVLGAWSILNTVAWQRGERSLPTEPYGYTQETVDTTQSSIASAYFDASEWYEDHPEELDARVTALFEKAGIADMVTVDTVRAWIRKSHEEVLGEVDRDAEHARIISPTRILVGLLPDEQYEEYLQPVLDAVMLLGNTMPMSERAGKSPRALKAEQDARGDAGDVRVDLTRMVWHDVYNEGVSLMKRGALWEAREKFDECFRHMREAYATQRDVYRLFANAGACHLATGERYIGKAFLEYARALNPQYTFARDQLARLESGELDKMIEQSTIENMVRNGRFGDLERLEDIRERWSERDILALLEEHGVSCTREEFLETVAHCALSDDVVETLLRPRYTGDEKDEDILNATATGLWRLWCPSVAKIEDIDTAVEWLQDAVFAKDDNAGRKVASVAIDALMALAEGARAPLVFARHRDYSISGTTARNLLVALCELIDSPLRTKALALAQRYTEHIQFRALSMVGWLDAEHVGASVDDETLDAYLERAPYESFGWQIVGWYACEYDHDDFARSAYERALKAVQARDRDGVVDMPHAYEPEPALMEAYDQVLDKLACFADDHEDPALVSRVREMSRDVQSRASTFVSKFSDGLDKLQKIVDDMDEKRLHETPGYRYYELLKTFDINFATDEPPEVSVHDLSHGGETYHTALKIGRNDPCACGSGKKYKKCCGK